jgi:hypothetical protein
MLLQPNNGGMAEGMACDGVMARGMAEWSNGGIDRNGRMAGVAGLAEWRNGRMGNGPMARMAGMKVRMVARMMVSIRKNDRIAKWR